MFFNFVTFIQFIIFLYAISSFILNHLLCTNFSLHVFVSEHFNSVCSASSLPAHRGQLCLSDPYLIPRDFQIPAFSRAIPILSFLAY
jgi:hypothetical protein